MKRKSINEFKSELSQILEEVHNGATCELTKYDKPYIRLVPVQTLDVRVGSLVGKNDFKKGILKNTDGKFLEYLIEDRGER